MAPAGTGTGSHRSAALPSTVTGTGAPVTATTAAAEKRRVRPPMVTSSAGASAWLPTARFASAKETGSKGPLGGTPTCQ